MGPRCESFLKLLRWSQHAAPPAEHSSRQPLLKEQVRSKSTASDFKGIRWDLRRVLLLTQSLALSKYGDFLLVNDNRAVVSIGPTGVPFSRKMGLAYLAAWEPGLLLERRLLGPTAGFWSVGLVGWRTCTLNKVPGAAMLLGPLFHNARELRRHPRPTTQQSQQSQQSPQVMEFLKMLYRMNGN